MYKKIIFALLLMFVFFNVNVKAADNSDWYFISQVQGRNSQPNSDYVSITDNIQNWRYITYGANYNDLTYFTTQLSTSPGGIPNNALGKYRVTTTYCVNYSYQTNNVYVSVPTNLDSVNVINRLLYQSRESCTITAPNGVVLTGNILKLTIDFQIINSGGFHLIGQRIVIRGMNDAKLGIMDIDIVNPVQYANNQNTQDIINNNNSNTSDITTAIGGMSSDIQNKIQSQINNDNNNTQSIINNNNSNTQSIINSTNANTQAINDMNNRDLSSSDKTPVDSSEYNSMHDKEDQLFDKMDEADINNLNIAIDTYSSNWVWSTMLMFFGSNSLINSFIISILSIGIIKMALGR